MDRSGMPGIVLAYMRQVEGESGSDAAVADGLLDQHDAASLHRQRANRAPASATP